MNFKIQIGFIDFEKAFDRSIRTTLCNIMKTQEYFNRLIEKIKRLC